MPKTDYTDKSSWERISNTTSTVTAITGADIILIPHLSCLSRNVTTQFEILKFARLNSKK